MQADELHDVAVCVCAHLTQHLRLSKKLISARWSQMPDERIEVLEFVLGDNADAVLGGNFHIRIGPDDVPSYVKP